MTYFVLNIMYSAHHSNLSTFFSHADKGKGQLKNVPNLKVLN